MILKLKKQQLGNDAVGHGVVHLASEKHNAVLQQAAGAKGKRNALPNSRIMIHQPLAGMEGTATELEIHAKEVLRVKQRMNEILLKHTGQTLEQIEADTDRDNFMLAEEAQKYGLIDKVLEHLPPSDTE